MTNQGIAPLLASTPVGITLQLLGDINYVDLTPASIGFGNYTYFSDDEISAFLTTSNNSPKRAVGNAFLQFAAAAVAESTDAGSADMSVDTSKRAADYRLIAHEWFVQADAEDQLDRINNGTMLVVSPSKSKPTFTPVIKPIVEYVDWPPEKGNTVQGLLPSGYPGYFA